MTEKFYTDNLDDEQALAVRRIKAQHGDHFRTAYLAADSGHEGETGIKWYEARLADEKTQSWIIEEYVTGPDIYGPDTDIDTDIDTDDQDSAGQDNPRTVLDVTEIDSRLCVFDALHACAVFEITARDNGMLPVSADTSAAMASYGAQPDIPHYATFARREGFPLEKKTKLPVPALDGQRLSKAGTFSPDLHEVLARSQGNMMPETQAKAAFLNSVMAKGQEATGARPTSTALLQPAEKSRLLQETTRTRRENQQALAHNKTVIKKNMKALREMRKTFDKSAANGFKVKGENIGDMVRFGGAGAAATGISGFLTYALWAGSAPLLLAIPASAALLGIAGIGALLVAGSYFEMIQAFPDKEMNFDRTCVRKAATRLDGPLKNSVIQAEKDAALAFEALRYRQAARNLADGGGFFARRKHTKALKRLYKTCHSYGMNEQETARFVDLQDQTMADRDIDTHIRETLDQSLRDLIVHIEHLKNHEPLHDLKALPPPPRAPGV